METESALTTKPYRVTITANVGSEGDNGVLCIKLIGPAEVLEKIRGRVHRLIRMMAFSAWNGKPPCGCKDKNAS
jgi:hypothetical protein